MHPPVFYCALFHKDVPGKSVFLVVTPECKIFEIGYDWVLNKGENMTN